MIYDWSEERSAPQAKVTEGVKVHLRDLYVLRVRHSAAAHPIINRRARMFLWERLYAATDCGDAKSGHKAPPTKSPAERDREVASPWSSGGLPGAATASSRGLDEALRVCFSKSHQTGREGLASLPSNSANHKSYLINHKCTRRAFARLMLQTYWPTNEKLSAERM
jgi:hypothetical protein